MVYYDLHRHLGGSIDAKTVSQISGIDCQTIEKEMLFQPGETRNFENFLNKFKILDTVEWTKESLQLALTQVLWDIFFEGLACVELKFTLDKYVNPDWSLHEILKWIINCNAWPDRIMLILSLKYEGDHQKQIEIAKLIEEKELMHYITGIDLVGDETKFDADFYAELLKPWKKAGKGIEAHVGETGPAQNVVDAIEKIGVDRIAHGIAAAEYPDVMRLACDRDICFDIAITSNYYTGVADLHNHPIVDMVNFGCNVTIGTDDPYILKTNMRKEYHIARSMGLTKEQLDMIADNSVKYAFRR